MKIRLWGTEEECRAATERLVQTPGLVVLSISEPRADRGASVLVRVYLDARLDPPLNSPFSTATASSRPRRADQRASALAQRMTGGRQRRALPPGGQQQ